MVSSVVLTRTVSGSDQIAASKVQSATTVLARAVIGVVFEPNGVLEVDRRVEVGSQDTLIGRRDETPSDEDLSLRADYSASVDVSEE